MKIPESKKTSLRIALAALAVLPLMSPSLALAVQPDNQVSPQPEVQAAVDAAANAPKQIDANLNPPCAACSAIPGLLIQQHKPTPLFSDDKPLELTLTGDFRAENNSFKGTKFPGTIELVENGKKEKITADFAVRGNFKQGVCRDFKPIRVYFHPDAHDTKDTIFGDIKEEMKIATHCQGWGAVDTSSEYVQGMLREYTGYKALNAMGLMSLQVRLAHITYKDAQGNVLATSFAFLEEPKGEMAKRFKEHNISQVDAAQAGHRPIAPSERIPFDFENEFMGDADKSYDGTHNGIFVAPKGSQDANAIVPYDYDLGAFAHTPYTWQPLDGITANAVQTWIQDYCGYRAQPDGCRANVLSMAQYVLKHRQATMDTIANSPVQDKSSMQNRAKAFFDGLQGFVDHPEAKQP